MHAGNGQLHQNEKSRQLQRRLYLTAKKCRNRRFHALYVRILRPDVLWRAWEEVRLDQRERLQRLLEERRQILADLRKEKEKLVTQRKELEKGSR
jgi:hypothetical protein